MKKILLIVAAVVLIIAGFWIFFGKSDSKLSLKYYVPKESSVVVTFDLVSLIEKSDLEELFDLPLLNRVEEDQGNLVFSFLSEMKKYPKESGLSFSKQPFLFYIDGKDGNTTLTGAVLGIQDQDEFSLFITKRLAEYPMQKSEEINFILDSKSNLLAWNKKAAVFLLNDKNAKLIDGAKELLRQEVKPVADNKMWAASFQKNKELNLYLNLRAFKEQNTNSIKNLPIASQGAVAYSFGFSFVEGAIEMETKLAFENSDDRELTQLFQLSEGQHLLPFTAVEKPFIAAQMQLNIPKLFSRLLSDEDSKKAVEDAAQSIGLSLKEFQNLFSGELAIAYSGMKKREVTRSFFGIQTTKEASVPQAGLYIGIKDLAKLKDLLEENGQKPSNGKYTFTIPFIGPVFMAPSDAGITLLLDEPMANIIADEKERIQADYDEVGAILKTHSNAAYFDLNPNSLNYDLMEFVLGKNDDLDSNLIITALKPMQYLTFWQGKKGGNVQIVLKEKDVNSLKQLILMANELYIGRLGPFQ